MLRKVLGVLLLGVLSACTQPDGRCSSSVECPTGGVCSNGFCSVAGEAPAGTCEPACSTYEACSADTQKCVSRYSDLTLSPNNLSVLGAGPHTVQATLRLVPGFEAVYPEALNFTVTKTGGTAQDLPAATRNEGVYTTQWNPTGDGDYELRVSVPEPGALSSAVQLSVDTTGPIFTVSVPDPVLAVSDGGTTYGDPASGYATAWRRDQVVAVQVRTNEQRLDPSTVKISLRGTDNSITEASVTALTGACDAGFCGVANLKLWEPAFNQFRGQMAINVQGSDTLKNAGSADTNVNVTRWKWAFDAKPGSIRSTPAVGQTGSIYFGTTSGSEGKVVALRPDGYSQWVAPLGAVEGGVAVGAVGASDAGTELVYVGAKAGNGPSLYALRGNNGATIKKCPGSGTGDTFGAGTLVGGIGLGAFGSGGLETAVSIYSANDTGSDPTRVVSVNASGTSVACREFIGDSDPILPVVQDGPIGINGTNLFYPSYSDSSGSKLVSYVFGSSSVRPGWPVILPSVPRSLALTGTDAGTDVIATAGEPGSSFAGGVFKVPQSGASASLVYPTSATARVYGLAVSSDLSFFGAQSSSGSSLVGLPLAGVGTKTEAASGIFRATPVVGRTSLYFVSTTGVVEARTKDLLAPRWNSGLPLLGTVDSSPTMDCSRDASGTAIAGMPGVLYVPANGKLHAFVVDNAGLDPDAKWPKYQHDARNTGNSATPITACP